MTMNNTAGGGAATRNTAGRRRVAKLSATLVAAILLLAAIGAVGVLAFSTLSDAKEPAYVYIDADDTMDSVQAKLRGPGHCSSLTGFRLCAFVLGYGESVRPGRYDVGSGLSAIQVVRRLRSGSESPVRLTIPQVWTKEQLAARLSRQLMCDSASLARLFADSVALASYDCDPATLVCLFVPNTYEVYWTIRPDELLARMHKEYKAYWNEDRLSKAEAQGLTPHEVVVLASIVDKETANAAEQPRVAGMYLNRLRIGMKLQADPTVKFALQQFGLRRILHEHLLFPSPYNTYVHAGLPPGPICLPSMASMEAVLRAEHHDYLYMCAKEDFSGTHRFAKTYSEHLENARRYQAALNRRGVK